MSRFTIREVVLVTAVVALALGWWLDRRDLLSVATATKVQLEAESAAWETRTQIGAAEHLVVLRAINDHGLALTSRDGKTYVVPYDGEPKAMFSDRMYLYFPLLSE